MIAVNPYQWFPSLYSKAQQEFYSRELVWEPTQEMETIPPHVYQISSMAYRGLALTETSQSILVSGESGAGKTETVKICMTHIASIRHKQSNSGTHKLVIQRVLDSNPLLEAFGNAKTRRNDNSSRFGKYIQLQFQRSKVQMESSALPELILAGSTCTTYLLEKSRVVFHHEDERTFHIFYQLLAAPSKVKGKIWKKLQNATSRDFRYVGASTTISIEGIDDRDAFQHTLNALELVGVVETKLEALLEALCIVLQLGNIVYLANGTDDPDDSCCVESVNELTELAEILGLDLDRLGMTLTHRTVTVNKETTWVPLRPIAAKEASDALAKQLYAKIFDWLVSTINDATCATKQPNYDESLGEEAEEEDASKLKNKLGVIGLLDIFGFEYFQVNSFEQLCINYANEMLQSKFTKDVFKSVHEEYAEQELDALEDISYDDNTHVLDLIQTPLTGLFSVLNEECIRPQGNDLAFCRKAIQANAAPQLGSSSISASPSSRGVVRTALFVEPRFQPYEFGIRHYAHRVIYDVRSFVTKNNDALPADLLECVCGQTTNPIVKSVSLHQSTKTEEEEVKDQEEADDFIAGHPFLSPPLTPRSILSKKGISSSESPAPSPRMQSRKSIGGLISSKPPMPSLGSKLTMPSLGSKSRLSVGALSSSKSPAPSPGSLLRKSFSAFSPGSTSKSTVSPGNFSPMTNKLSMSVADISAPPLAADQMGRHNFRRKSSTIAAVTVSSKYKNQLHMLMHNLQQSQSQYIRCIKPNTVKVPIIMEHDTTLDQLRSAGVVAAVTMSRAAFPNRMDHIQVLLRFEPVWRLYWAKRSGSGSGSNGISLAAASSEPRFHKEHAKRLLSVCLKELETKHRGKVKQAFAIGKTRTYFTAGALEYLEAQRFRGLELCALAIQTRARGMCVRHTLNLTHLRQRIQCRRRLQSWWRMVQAHQMVNSLRRARDKRKAQAQLAIDQSKAKAQRALDESKAQAQRASDERMAQAEQLAASLRLASKKLDCATRLQYWWRVAQAQQIAKSLRQARNKLVGATRFQTWWRMAQAQQITKALRQARIKLAGATRLQNWWRVENGRVKEEKERRRLIQSEEERKAKREHVIVQEQELTEELAEMELEAQELESILEIGKTTDAQEIKLAEEDAENRVFLHFAKALQSRMKAAINKDPQIIACRKKNKQFRKQIEWQVEEEIKPIQHNCVAMEESNQQAKDAIIDARNAYMSILVRQHKLRSIIQSYEEDVENKQFLVRTRLKQYEVEKKNRALYFKAVKNVVKTIKKKIPGHELCLEAERVAKSYMDTVNERNRNARIDEGGGQDSFDSLTSTTESSESESSATSVPSVDSDHRSVGSTSDN
jgi:myosin heavy subunit